MVYQRVSAMNNKIVASTDKGEAQVVVHGQRAHIKASERYVDVTFNYADGISWEGSVPIEYRRTGTDLQEDEEIAAYLLEVQPHCHTVAWPKWKAEQESFWQAKPNAGITKAFFDVLSSFRWTCVTCQCPSNPNWARRIQDLKESGYTIATDTGRYCPRCERKRTQLLLVPIPRGGISGYETWSPEVRKRIVRVLNSYDVYEGRSGNRDALLPDHKFPEIRWTEKTRRDSLDNLSDEDIRHDFQLMTNQRNLQKREVCRRCYQTGKRGTPFGIRFFWQGNENWPRDIPRSGKDAERGCLGCGWYDIEKWREVLNSRSQNEE